MQMNISQIKKITHNILLVAIVFLFLQGFFCTCVAVAQQQTPTVKIPNVVGKSEAEAIKMITDLKLTVNEIKVCGDENNKGTVVQQYPVEGVEKPEQTEVTILVSAGECVTVPDVVGKTQQEAQNILKDAGFTYEVKFDCNSSIDMGKVISQDPAKGKQVPKDTKITIVVSATCVTVPDVVGKTQDEAQTALTTAGLTNEVKQDCSNTIPAGNVISQNPVKGSQVPQGTKVTITVSSGPCVTVPNVVGLDLETAKQTLKNEQLLVVDADIKQKCSDTIPEGNVISQDPKAGQEVQKGSKITLTVSTGPCNYTCGSGCDNTGGNNSGKWYKYILDWLLISLLIFTLSATSPKKRHKD